MIRTRWRLRIILIVVILGGISFTSIILARFLDFGANVQDPLYFDSSSHSRFLYDNGTIIMNLDFDSFPINSNRTICNLTLNDISIGKFNVTPDGRYIDPVKGPTQNYTVFWVHIVTGVGSEFAEFVGNNYSIFDPIGILGAPNTEYILTITAKYVYWAESSPLLGAQFSLKFEVRNLNNVRIAKGEMDHTCGMLFNLDIGSANLKTLELIYTNYDISRNRLTGWPVILIAACAAPILVFTYLHVRTKMSRDEKLDITFLVAAGGAILIIDIFIDVWMYAPLGFIGNLLTHGIMTGILIAYAILRKIGIKWTIPAILELAFLIAIVGSTGDAYVPHLTAFMGLLISWLCLVWASGYQRIPSRTKMGKILSEFV